MNWELIQIRVDKLNRLSFENIMERYLQIGISHEARQHLPTLLYDEILGTGDHQLLEFGFVQWQTTLSHDGRGDVWNSIQKKFFQNAIGLCKNLREIFDLEKQLIETEDQIIQCLSEIPNKISTLNSQQGQVPLEYIQSIILDLGKVADRVTEMISIWKHSKRYDSSSQWTACPKIESWLDVILTHLLSLWDRLKYLQDMFYQMEMVNGRYSPNSPVQALLDTTEKLISRILNATFILEEHPSRFVKKENASTLKFRHLMGKYLYREPGVSPAISLLNNKEVDSILANHADHFRTAMHTSPPGVLSVYNVEVTQNGQFAIDFSKLRVLKPGRVQGSNTDRVTIEKFCFLCEMTVGLRPELKMKVWTISRPLICGSHGNQVTRSLGTILWDNGTCVPNQRSLTVPGEVAWSTLESALDRVHMSIANIPLSEENKKYLKTRLIPVDADNDVVTFKAFCVDNLPDHKFTFWEWFHEGLKFGDTYFKKLWEDGYFVGFLGREVSRQFLSNCLEGTFLIRFSESIGTAITISFKCSDGLVYSAGPFTKDILEWKRLGEIISELKDKPISLKQFYPDKCIPDLATLVETQPAPKTQGCPGYVHLWKKLVPGL